MHFKNLANCLLLALLCAVTTWAQDTGAILTGTVTDPQGAVIANAKVIVTDVRTGVAKTVTTNGAGFYFAPGLQPGEFQVTPIMVGGVLYTSTAMSQIAAIDAATGKTLWVHDPEAWRVKWPTIKGFQTRGVSYWRAGQDERIFFATGDSRLLALDERGVTFRWKDYRAKGKTRYKAMTLSPEEFMRRFLLHVLPGGFHRIRHYGLLANGSRRLNLAAARQLLHVPADVLPDIAAHVAANDEPPSKPPTFVCRRCGRPMAVVLRLAPECSIRAPPQAAAR